MISGVTTLFTWTLKMDSKSIFPHIIRAVFACFMLFSISMAFADAFGTSSMGLRFFESICYMNVVLISVSGISYFVTAVTEEKDAGTYALLRLAGMNALSITLGKSTSRLVSSLMLLVIQLPFTFLGITLGGILWQQIIASYLALAAWMILVANFALFCSVRCQTSGRAAGLAGTILGLFFVLPGIIERGLAAAPPGLLSQPVTNFLETLPDAIQLVNVAPRLRELLHPSGATSFLSLQFWLSLLIAAALFVISTLMLDYWSVPEGAGEASPNPAARRWSVGRCWKLAIAWKEFLYFTGGRSFFVIRILAGGLLLSGFLVFQELEGQYRGFRLQGEYGWYAFLALVGVLSLEVLLYSCGSLFHEVRGATQPTLAALPLSAVRILLEKIAGCAVALIPVIFWIFVTLCIGGESISRDCSATMVISYFIVLGFSSHVAALLSLYTRWAALPLTILFTMPAFFCLATPIFAMTAATNALARSHNIQLSLLLSGLINLFWTWLFVLLPLEIWIRDRWIHMSRE